jgi:glycosyltransferase involved in cell wall biosynthesis
VSVVPYGVDTQVFAPRDPGFSREMLGVPRGARVVLFVAHSVENDRKGFRTLRGALDGLRGQDDLFLLSLGKGAPSVPDDVAHRHLGFVTEDRYLSAVYSAADVFVVPSHQDNLPATVLESLACGTPVVGSQVGGIPEMVRPGETGALVPDGEPDALAEGIRGLLRDGVGIKRVRDRCREVAVEEYPLDLQARRYADLYRDLLGDDGGGRFPGQTEEQPTTGAEDGADGVAVAPAAADVTEG